MRVACLALTVLGCARQDSIDGYRVAAAASLVDVVEAAVSERERRGLEPEIRANFAASSTLARQLRAGAEADVFLSANAAWIDDVIGAGLAAGEPVVLATNSLVTVRPRRPGAAAEPIAAPGVRWTTADPAHVPLGVYARAALEACGRWDALAPDLIAARDARAALRLVELGEVDWGIVYRTDALASDRVVVVENPDLAASSLPVVGVALGPEGRELLAWLAAPAQAFLWTDRGFTAPAGE